MRLFAFTGVYGAGKTYSTIYLSYFFHRKYGIDIYANIDVDFGVKINPLRLVDDIVGGKFDRKPKIYIFDEFHRYANSSRSNSNLNQFFRLWIDMCRKNNIYVFYTAQRLMTVDKHIREMTDIIFELPRENRSLIRDRGELKAYVYGELMSNVKIVYIPFIENIANMYDSNEVIPPASIETFTKKYKKVLERYWENVD